MEKHIIENEIPKTNIEDIGSNLDDFEIMQTLGKGSYGFVSKVKSKKNQKIYAMKMIDLGLVNDKQEIDLLMNEIKIIHSLNSPHIVKCYNNFQIGNKVYILMEYINNGDLKGYIQANSSMQKAISEEEIWEILYQCMAGLYYIHKNNLIHRDIKPANLFLTDDKIVKIGDFGVSAERKVAETINKKAEKETLMIGTPLYMSPEIFAHKPYGSKVDVYSLGCTIYEMCYFSAPRLPLPGVNQNGEIFTDLKEIPKKANQNVYSQDLQNIINMMIAKDQNQRPNSQMIFEEIKKKYNSFKMQSTSIYCVYRSLISYNNLCNKLTKHSPTKQMIPTIPITYTLNLALNNMLVPNNNSYPIINNIRDILTFNNSTLIDPGEIECMELINYIITKSFMETNHNKNVSNPNLYTEETDNDTFNRDAIMKKYLLNFQNCFKSFISNFFFGTFEINRLCSNCNQLRTFFENFYYLNINLSTAIKSNYNITDPNFIYFCLQNGSKIYVNKYCLKCNSITMQQETKEIFSNPINIIIYINKENLNNTVKLNYPLSMNLTNKLLNLQNQNGNPNVEQFNLKAVIQESVQNGQKMFGCCFQFNQKWYIANGYNTINEINSPYDFNFGSVEMLFYSSQM